MQLYWFWEHGLCVCGWSVIRVEGWSNSHMRTKYATIIHALAYRTVRQLRTQKQTKKKKVTQKQSKEVAQKQSNQAREKQQVKETSQKQAKEATQKQAKEVTQKQAKEQVKVLQEEFINFV